MHKLIQQVGEIYQVRKEENTIKLNVRDLCGIETHMEFKVLFCLNKADHLT
jgi:hypothetical protein